MEWTYAEALVDDGKGDVDVYEKKDVDALLNALEARIKELRQVPKWISIDYKRPEDMQECIVTDGKDVWYSVYSTNWNEWINGAGVTHWMLQAQKKHKRKCPRYN